MEGRALWDEIKQRSARIDKENTKNKEEKSDARVSRGAFQKDTAWVLWNFREYYSSQLRRIFIPADPA